MKTKRILSLLLVILMLASLVLTSCQNTQGDETTQGTTLTETESEQGETTGGSADGTENVPSSGTETTVGTESSSKEETSSKVETSSTETSSKVETENKTETSSKADDGDKTETSSKADDEDKTETTSKVDVEDKTETTSKVDVEDKTETTSEEETSSETEEETELITDVMIGETIDAEYATDFTVAKVFSSDMVVQRGEHIRVWGFAPASENGKKVSGEFKGMFAEAIVENGEWCLTFGARLEADVNGAQMKIYTDSKTVTFDGVLVGDVYLVMGQSNANYRVTDHLAYDDPLTQGGGESAIDPDSIIRLNHLSNANSNYGKLGTDYVYSDLQNKKFWTRTTVEDTKEFSAIGYYFARHLVEKDPTVPIGLMQISKGGAPIASFLPNDLAEKWDQDYYDQSAKLYYSNVSKEHLGRYFYNCYLAPISRYSIAGVVWYQGESDNQLKQSVKYNEIFTDLMTRLRSTHNTVNKNFPVFITEIPSIYKKPADFTGTKWHYMELGMIRAYMGTIPVMLKNSYVSVSGDLWTDKTFYNNLHPNCKYEQAERLAALANVIINKKGTLPEATGPIFKSAAISEDKKTVVITFTNVGDGLATKDGGIDVLGIIGLKYSIMGHSVVTPVSATITAKNKITVTFDTEVKAVGYNYMSSDLYGETINLCNSFGCPASAFLSPYPERDLGTYTKNDFVPVTNTTVKYTKMSVDRLYVNGNSIFGTDVSAVTGLAQNKNKATIIEGSSKLSSYGWIGFEYEILMLGYSINGADAVLNTYPTAPEDSVIRAGGKHACRFTIDIPVEDLAPGEYSIDVIALVNVDGGKAVKFLSFTLVVEERPFIPEHLDVPAHNADGYGYVRLAVDAFTCDGTKVVEGNVPNRLKEADYTVTLTKGAQKLRFTGWIGFGTTIEMFGYAIDGNATLASKPGSAEDAVLKDTNGGKNAKRYDISFDISNLEAGYHTIDILVKINSPEGFTEPTSVLQFIYFTLIIEE